MRGFVLGSGVADEDALRCPACGCPEVQVVAPPASACLPFPRVELLRCPACGNAGRRLRIAGRTPTWERAAPE